ncbi:undecaprenyl-diphosphatase [Sulfurivirga caldicuralii]|uniref:undecaprenyl-diphosphate phosphatase n=1 Tax=Sulfurivirga caldicuralii TaxID=364032 RepID=A0A1N6GA75_9GAMM|nr:phosphatase PAP2 family protein [Sulfurivirga caldicuralii]SIO04425.1 undecaprenyl-diphosphatase [Sulfurivirga caldicuralii]
MRPRLRLTLAALLLLLTALTLGVTIQVPAVQALDTAVSHWARDNAAQHALPVWIALTQLGYRVPDLLWLAFLSLLFWQRYRHLVWQLWCATLSSALLIEGLKRLFARPRPDGMLFDASGFSYPSGHAAVAIALYAFSGWLLWRVHKHLVAVMLGVLALLIIASRVILNVHYPSDVIGGALIGLAAIACARALISEPRLP